MVLKRRLRIREAKSQNPPAVFLRQAKDNADTAIVLIMLP
ncbi:MAG: hypothetical protein RIS64_3253 [Bacteroidota bacterium]|jgi:hypothetical protein